jgi:tetratricopeptide (TPR) repeat protein
MRNGRRRLGNRFYATLILCLAFLTSAQGQEKPQPSAPIDLDKELQAKAPQDRAKSYYYYSLSKWYEDKGDLTRAVAEMRNALRYNEGSAAVRVGLASLLEKTGSLRDALVEAEEAAKVEPKNPEPHWVLANLYFRMQGRDRAASRESLKKAVKELETMREDAPADERPYFALGQAYLELDEQEKAVQAYEKFQELVPSTDAGYLALAEYFEKRNDTDKSIEFLQRALKNQPEAPKSLLTLANLYSKLERHREAAPIYRKLLEVTGDNPAIKRQLATSLLDSGDFKGARQVLEEVIKGTPKDREAQLLLGRALIGGREYAGAIAVLKEIVEDAPDNFEARFYMGTAYEQSGNPAEAAKIFSLLLDQTNDTSVENKANRVVFQQHLAAAYQDLGDNEKAIQVYESILKNESQPNPRLMFLLINAYRVSRQVDKAISLGKQQFEKNPSDVNLGLVYARALADGNKTKEGIEILQKMLQVDPSNIDVYVNLSQIYLQSEKYSDAEKILRRAEERKLDGERLKFQLATVYERQKDFDRAETLFKEVLKDNPKNAVVLNYMGYMLADRGIRLDEAVKYVEEALTIDPSNGAYLDSMGWTFYKLNQLDKAEQYLLKAVDIVKNDPTIYDHLGDLYIKTGNLEKAQDSWQRSIQTGSEAKEIQKVREKLEKVQETLRKQKKPPKLIRN